MRQLRGTQVSLGLILKVPLDRVEGIEAQLENLFSGKVVYRRFSAGRLWIVDKDPREGR